MGTSICEVHDPAATATGRYTQAQFSLSNKLADSPVSWPGFLLQ